MGAKTGLLAFADTDVPTALRHAREADVEVTVRLVRRAFPDGTVTPGEGSTLAEGTYPPPDVTYAAALAGVDILCDTRFMLERPSELPTHLVELAAGRRIVLHAMHSGVDGLAFAVWEGGELVRSLSLSPDAGIVEDIGARLPFELPFWAGDHPVTPIPGWDAGRAYPLDFHPLELGAEALRNLCGFVLEGRPAPDDIEPFDVHLHGFHVTDPTGAEAAAREAAVRAALRAMKPARRFRYAPDGSLVEVDGR